MTLRKHCRTPQDAQMTMEASLSALPAELLLQVAHWLDYDSEINAFSQANRRLYATMNRLLYSTKRQTYEGRSPGTWQRCASYAIQWAIIKGYESTVRKTLDGGEKPSVFWVEQAARHGHEHILKLLYSYDIDNKSGTVLYVPPEGLFPEEYDQMLVRGWSPIENRETPLEQAAANGHESIVRFLLEQGKCVKGVPASERQHELYPLVAAAEAGHLSIVKILVEAACGADAEGLARGLKAAVPGGHTDVVRFLVDGGADVNSEAEWNDGPRALVLAAMGGHVDIVQCLLDHGARDVMMALCAAGQYQRKDIVKLLAKRYEYPRAAKDVTELTAVACSASACGLFELLDECVSLGWEVNSPPIAGFEDFTGLLTTPLTVASTHGQVDIVRRLLSLGPDPNGGRALDDGRNDEILNPLSAALRGGHTHIVSDLLGHGADFRLDRNTHRRFLQLTDAASHQGALELLVRKGDALEYLTDEEVQHAITEAFRHDNAAALQMFIDRGVDLTDTHDNALAALLSRSDETTLGILLQNVYAPHPTEDPTDKRFIHDAIRERNLPLLRHLASVGFTYLTSPPPAVQADFIKRASKIKHTRPQPLPATPRDVLGYLLNRGFDVDALDNQGLTPLLAVMAWRRRSCPASIKLLIEFGANPCFRSAGGECPLVAAVVSKRYSPAAADIVKTLLQAAEDQSIPLDVVESQVEEALDVAERGEHTIILRPLRYWYWRSKYPVPS